MIKSDIKCPACNDNQTYFYQQFSDQLYGLQGSWIVMKCRNCRHEFMDPIPTDSDLASYYSTDKYYSFSTLDASRFYSTMRKYSRRLLPKMLTDKNILDYGCGDGEVLLIARERGAKTFGIEFGDTAKFVASKTGLEVQSSVPSEWKSSMDYVRSFHSFEHIKDPMATLELFAALCKNGGKILIGVPTMGQGTQRYLVDFSSRIPLHIHGFTPESIRALAERNNLKVIALKTPGGFRGLLGSISITLQNIFLKKSHEPRLRSLVMLFPLYFVLVPYILLARICIKEMLLKLSCHMLVINRWIKNIIPSFEIIVHRVSSSGQYVIFENGRKSNYLPWLTDTFTGADIGFVELQLRFIPRLRGIKNIDIIKSSKVLFLHSAGEVLQRKLIMNLLNAGRRPTLVGFQHGLVGTSLPRALNYILRRTVVDIFLCQEKLLKRR